MNDQYDSKWTGPEIDTILERAKAGGDIDATKLLSLAAADAYSETKTYVLGAYCTVDGKLYRCTTAITTAETWTADHWTETTMGAELVSIYADLAGKAPAGYGLGASDPEFLGISNTSLNSLIKNGWYFLYTGNTDGPDGVSISYAILFVSSARSDLVKVQKLTLGTGGYQGHELSRSYSTVTGAWSEWEWVNPPMEVGVEYRTTERYMGKPVYAKLIDLGLSAAGGTVSANANVSNFESYVFVQAIVGGTATPIFPNTSFTGAWCVYVSNINSTTISVYTGSSRGGDQCYCLLKYTKTTD